MRIWECEGEGWKMGMGSDDVGVEGEDGVGRDYLVWGEALTVRI